MLRATGVCSTVLISTCLLAQAGLPKADVTIDSLTLAGTTRLSQAEQQAIIDDVEDHKYQRDDPGQIKERVLYALQTRGYFRAHVSEPEVKVLSQTRRQEVVAVKIAIDEREQYRLKEISFQNVKAFPPEELRKQFPLQNGDIFDTAKIRTGLEGMRKLYLAKGYVTFTPIPQTVLDNASRTIALSISVEEGNAATGQ